VFPLALLLIAAQLLPQQLFPRIQMPGVKGETSPDGWFVERSFVELDAIRYDVALSNDSTVAFVIDQARLRQAFTVRLGKSGEIPVTVQWAGPVGDFTKVPTTLSTPEHVEIEAGRTATWTMVIRRADGQTFTWGDYPVIMTMTNLRPVVSSPGGGTWGGRTAESGLWLRLVSVKAP
jgi:hypothetical protein